MARIVGGGGKSGSANKSVGRPGFGRLVAGESTLSRGRRSIQRLFARDPANGITALIGTAQDILLGVKIAVGASLTTAIAGVNNDITYTAKVEGLAGNSIRVTYVVAAGTVARSIVVAGNDITVNLATTAGVVNATETATNIVAAINATTAAAAKLTAAVKTGDTGAGLLAAMALTNLAGGKNAVTSQVNVATEGPVSQSVNEIGLKEQRGRTKGVVRVRNSPNRRLTKR